MSNAMHILSIKVETIVNYHAFVLKTPITYANLAAATGGHSPRSKHIAQILGNLIDEDIKNGNPLRSSLVIRKGKLNKLHQVTAFSRRPGPGYFSHPRLAGASDAALEIFWQGEMARLGIDTSQL